MLTADATIGAVIRRIRNQPSYRLDEALSLGDILREVVWRGRSLIRAQWKLTGVRGGRLRFVEPGCSIRHRRHLSLGSGSVLEAYSRLHCLSNEGVRIGKRVTVGKFAIVECTSVLWNHGVGLVIGDDSSVGDYAFLGCAGGVKIGERVLMGQHVSVHSENHDFDDATEAIKDQGVTSIGIVIDSDCWIGAGAIILDGVTLGEGSVVAAGAVVSRSFPAGSVIGGVPARVLKTRDSD